MGKRVCLVTFGCQMNRLDSELIRGLLEGAGYVMTEREDDADVILYNTCSVRENAENRVWGRVASLKRTKADRPNVVIGVLGCMAQKEREHIFEVAPHVDVVCGTRAFPDLVAYIGRAVAHREHQLAVDDARDLGDVTAKRRLAPGQFHAYVSVMRGCDNFCSYCIVPYVRGRETSRPVAEIVDEVKRLVDAGVVEVTLLGQNISSYGKNLRSRSPDESGPRTRNGWWGSRPTTGRATTSSAQEGPDLATLLRAVSDVADIRRIWFVTGHPRDMTADVFEAMRDCPNVMEYLHMPAQSGSTRILERMNRGYTRERYLDLVREAKGIVPGLGVASDFIVGFPGETEDDFRETVSLIEACRFSMMFAFKYSPRPGTKAAGFDDDVPWETRQSRNRELLAVQERIASEENAAFVGRTVEVLIEGPSKSRPDRLTGRSRDHRIVIVTKGSDPFVTHAEAGQVVPVTITRATALALYGNIADADDVAGSPPVGAGGGEEG